MSVLIRALHGGLDLAHSQEILPVFRVSSSLYQSIPIPDYTFLATVCFHNRNIHLSCQNTFEPLTKLTKIFVELIRVS